MRRVRLALVLAVAMSSCRSEPPPQAISPALWEVSDHRGTAGYLFGTIHALPDGIAWRRPAIDRALEEAGVLVVEVAAVGDDAATAQVFARLARTPGLPPLAERVAPDLRDELAALTAETDLAGRQFRGVEDWAAALILSQTIAAATGLRAANGVDRALVTDAGDKRIAQLESAQAQLALFDRLPAAEQRAMLDTVVRTAAGAQDEAARLRSAWERGDEAALAALAREGLLAEPGLRERLLVARNRAWLGSIERRLRAGEKPFIAVGAAHLPGPDGIAAQLAARGWTVRRVP